MESVAELRGHLVDQAMVQGYTRIPPEPDPWIEAASRHAAGELEPW